MNTTSGLTIDPHAYTSGRWLRHDKARRDARYIKFNFEALCQKVIDLCPGAEAITTFEKLEGGFNRVFIFTLDNAKKIVARLPFPVAGPPKLTTASEVATIRYLQAKTRIPIPTILDWHDNAGHVDNSIGNEYIIMEHAAGVPLGLKWRELDGRQQVQCMQSIYETIKELNGLEFPAFGSIYFNNSVDSRCTKLLDKDFCIGPNSNPRYWDCNPPEQRYYDRVKQNRGPWTTIEEFFDGLVGTGISRIPPADPEYERRPTYHGSVDEHLRLLEDARIVLRQIAADSRIKAASSPLLFHPDLHLRNIFVSETDPTVVSSIIDWQAAGIEPAFWYSNDVPDFVRTNEYCEKAFDLLTRVLTPKIWQPRREMDENHFRPIHYSHRTWKDGAAALHDELIETSRHWTELGYEGQCLYPLPSPEELANHKLKYGLFEAAEELRGEMASVLGAQTDGIVSAAKGMFEQRIAGKENAINYSLWQQGGRLSANGIKNTPSTLEQAMPNLSCRSDRIHALYTKSEAQQSHNHGLLRYPEWLGPRQSAFICPLEARPRSRDPLATPHPDSHIVASDPDHISWLWKAVMSSCNHTISSRGKITGTSSATGSVLRQLRQRPASISTPASVTSGSIAQETAAKLTDADFTESVLEPHGITIQIRGLNRDLRKHFDFLELPSDPESRLQIYKQFAHGVWLEPTVDRVNYIRREFKAMQVYSSNQAEYSASALRDIFLDAPRYPWFPEEQGEKGWLPVRLLQLAHKPPQGGWHIPPLIFPSQKRYEWDIRPDCAYYVSLQAFESNFRPSVSQHVFVVQHRAFCPYLTIEFKKDEFSLDTARYQVAVASAIALYNRYCLKARTLQATQNEWTEKDKDQMRHYGITFTAANWNLWCTVPKTFPDWTGCTMSTIYSGS
ncbi:hypothetical protein O1611_g3144 [Lasiodiplodia mahajangana]|uniref:Uncharacterized protein n=1 Tax=Lasiodiplodia mahajangana TaxID=1108764 RepID=A0ACC2JT85_9PEZI|nr:hypothetical protein O1611_g3144 [Lasiodiplodia mahajangana]